MGDVEEVVVTSGHVKVLPGVTVGLELRGESKGVGVVHCEDAVWVCVDD